MNLGDMNDKDLIEKLKILLAEKMLETEESKRELEMLKDDYMRLKHREVFWENQNEKFQHQIDMGLHVEGRWVPFRDKRGLIRCGDAQDVVDILNTEMEKNHNKVDDHEFGLVFRSRSPGEVNDDEGE